MAWYLRVSGERFFLELPPFPRYVLLILLLQSQPPIIRPRPFYFFLPHRVVSHSWLPGSFVGKPSWRVCQVTARGGGDVSVLSYVDQEGVALWIHRRSRDALLCHMTAAVSLRSWVVSGAMDDGWYVESGGVALTYPTHYPRLRSLK